MESVPVRRLPLAREGACALDAACGEGRHIRAIGARFPQARVVGVDASPTQLAAARARSAPAPALARARLERLPFPDAVFDAVICSEALEHIPDYFAALRELRRVLKPGGTLAVSVPNAWIERLCWRLAPRTYPNQPGGHIRVFPPKALTADLRALGFRVRATRRAHGLDGPWWAAKCLFGPDKPDNLLLRLGKRVIERAILKPAPILRALDKALAPVCGKSFAVLAEKPGDAA